MKYHETVVHGSGCAVDCRLVHFQAYFLKDASQILLIYAFGEFAHEHTVPMEHPFAVHSRGAFAVHLVNAEMCFWMRSLNTRGVS